MLKEINAKSMLHYHEKTFATNWDANIYRGCEHNCKYCFAQYSHKYMETENFFEEIFVKANADLILRKEFKKRKWRKFPVNVCGVSDCYQPEEKTYKIMPKVIKSFIDYKNPLVITTKSTLILRDIELIKELNEVSEVTILVSVSTLDEEKRKLIEPNAAPTIERLEMLKQFKEIGCKTAVLLMPIMPYLSDSDENLDTIFKTIKEYNLGAIITGILHLRGNTKNVFFSFLKESYPDLLDKYIYLYSKGSADKEYRNYIYRKIEALREKYNLFDVYEPSLPKKEYKERSLF